MTFYRALRGPGLVVALCSLAVLAFFHRAAFADVTFTARDNLRVHLPLHAFWAERVRDGSWPGWYPYDGFGQPFVGMFISAALHPFNLLYLVMPAAAALKWSLLLAYVGAAAGAFALGRCLGLGSGASAAVAGAFTGAGYSVSISNNASYWVAAAALPWAWLAAQRFASRTGRGGLLPIAVTLALVLCGGDPQLFLVASLGVLLVAAASPAPSPAVNIARALGALAAAALLSAAQLLPGLSIGREAWVTELPLDTALRWSGHPVRALEAALGPLLLDEGRSRLLSPEVGRVLDPLFRGAWVDSQHLGLGVLLLAAAGAFGRARRAAKLWLSGAFLLLVVLWLGRRGALYGFLHQHLFIWSACRFPEKLTPSLVLVLAVAAGFGAQALADDGRLARRFSWLGLGLAAALAGLAELEVRGRLISRVAVARLWPFVPEVQAAQLGANWVRCTVETAVVLVALAACWRLVRRGELRSALTASVVCLYLAWVGRDLYQVAPVQLLELRSPLLGPMGAQSGSPLALGGARTLHRAVLTRLPAEAGPVGGAELEAAFAAETLEPDVGALSGMEAANAYLPAAGRRVLHAIHPLSNGALFNVRYAILGREEAAALGRSPGEPLAGFPRLGVTLFANAAALPRVYLAAARCAGDEHEALAVLPTLERPGEEAVVECGPGGHPPAGAGEVFASRGSARVQRYGADEVVLDVDAERPSVLVLNDAYYRGWHVAVDGAEAPLMPANGAVRGAFVSEGRHVVRFWFQAPGLRLGVAISLATLLALVALAYRDRSRGSRPSGSRAG